MEHLYGSLFKTTERAYGPLCSHGVIIFSSHSKGLEASYFINNLDDDFYICGAPHSLLIPRGLI